MRGGKMKRRSWRDLSPGQRLAVSLSASAEIALTTLAVVDLTRRPRERVRGPKALWWAALFVQPVGPIAYFWKGRRGATGP